MQRFTLFFVMALLVLVPTSMVAQDDATSEWQVTPSIQLVDLFPSKSFINETPYGSTEHSFGGFGFNVNTRAVRRSNEHVAFTFGGGALWYESSRSIQYEPSRLLSDLVAQGIGTTLRNKRFTVFPLSVGLEAEFPDANDQQVMFFVGGNLSANFIDGDLEIGEQVKGGYGFGAGFIVRPFEFGVRYGVFSDIRNLGASIGIQLNPIRIK